MDRRSFLMASASVLAVGPVALAPRLARASTSRLLTLEELVAASTYVVLGTAQDRTSSWEDLRSGRRIVTYTRVTVEQAVVGSPERELRVRTLGGVVGKIGQTVAGEARLVLGAQSMLFLASAGDAVAVVAMAQGHYPVVTDGGGVARLSASPETDLLLPRPGPMIWARDRLVGAALGDAVKAVAAAVAK